MSNKDNPPHYLSIHYLRAIAASMVVGVHCFTFGLVEIAYLSSVDWLRHGVALFFVISGFVMVVSVRDREISATQFFIRRLIRIAPLYWILSLAWIAFTSADQWVGMGWVASSLLFIPSVDPVSGLVRAPVLEPGWSLNFEMLFYILFACSLALHVSIRHWAVMFLLGALLVADNLMPLPPALAFLANPLLALFAGGMLIARHDLRLPVAFLPAGFAAFALVPAITDNVIAGVLLPAMAIVLAARSLDGRLPAWRFPMLIGDASYSIYLSHIFVMQALRSVAAMVDGAVAFVVLLAASAVVGVLVYRAVEIPATNTCRRWFQLLLATRMERQLA